MEEIDQILAERRKNWKPREVFLHFSGRNASIRAGCPELSDSFCILESFQLFHQNQHVTIKM
jgi:hypothetical protein